MPKVKTKTVTRADTIVTRSKTSSKRFIHGEPQLRVYKNKKSKKVENVAKNRRNLQKEIDKDYYPDKKKRNSKAKNIVLQPKHNYTVVADVNNCKRRKMNVPKKDVNASSDEESTNEILLRATISKVITTMQEADELDDEDFMEILTCPSPVWWEEAPPGYIEEPISAQYPKNKKTIDELIQEESKRAQKRATKPISGDTSKRNNLEALLGNLKRKLSTVTTETDNLINNIADKETQDNHRQDDKKDDDSRDNIVSNNQNVTADEIKLLDVIDLISDETDDENLNMTVDSDSLSYLENTEIPMLFDEA
ncbi:unnamed protein product [Leptosia nina]|uniref:Uncharacterized protein n=1 Tax=Leptosia nina TaxID=320188 RepID=A0AAV1JLN7_9NEOP